MGGLLDILPLAGAGNHLKALLMQGVGGGIANPGGATGDQDGAGGRHGNLDRQLKRKRWSV